MRNVVSWKPLVLGASFLLYGAGTAFATETDYLYPTSSTGHERTARWTTS